MKNIVDFTDKHILIVGDSAVAGNLANIICKLGGRVDWLGKTITKIEKIISGLDGKENHCRFFDIKEIEKIEAVIEDNVKLYGKYDGLAYCGCDIVRFDFELGTPLKVHEVFISDFFAFYEIVRQVTRNYRYNEGMRIVGLSSVFSLKGRETFTAYSASKSAIDGAVRSMAVELAPKGICINTVAAGIVDSDNIGGQYDTGSMQENDFQVYIDRQLTGIGEAQDIANTVAFFLSNASRFFTGQCIVADGGYTA